MAGKRIRKGGERLISFVDHLSVKRREGQTGGGWHGEG